MVNLTLVQLRLRLKNYTKLFSVKGLSLLWAKFSYIWGRKSSRGTLNSKYKLLWIGRLPH